MTFNEKLRAPGGFYLPNGPRHRRFTTKNKMANFTTTELEKYEVGADELILMTVRSHDQFNTTIYEYNDRYRGIHGERRVLFMNPEDEARFGGMHACLSACIAKSGGQPGAPWHNSEHQGTAWQPPHTSAHTQQTSKHTRVHRHSQKACIDRQAVRTRRKRTGRCDLRAW